MAVGVIIGLVRRLSVPVDEPFTTLRDESTQWGEEPPHKWEAAGQPLVDDGAITRHVQTARWLVD